MSKTLEMVTLVYRNKMDRLYDEHKQNLEKLLIEHYDNQTEYIKQYTKEVDHYIKMCNDLRSEFVIDSINVVI